MVLDMWLNSGPEIFLESKVTRHIKIWYLFNQKCQNRRVLLVPHVKRSLDLIKIYYQLSAVCHLEGWDREDGREAEEGGDMGTYVCIWLTHFGV